MCPTLNMNSEESWSSSICRASPADTSNDLDSYLEVGAPPHTSNYNETTRVRIITTAGTKAVDLHDTTIIINSRQPIVLILPPSPRNEYFTTGDYYCNLKPVTIMAVDGSHKVVTQTGDCKINTYMKSILLGTDSGLKNSYKFIPYNGHWLAI